MGHHQSAEFGLRSEAMPELFQKIFEDRQPGLQLDVGIAQKHYRRNNPKPSAGGAAVVARIQVLT
jgi:hypothetical protein